ncbi:polysaccharide deacetylase family protein [Candidatus Accumulibacter meliphilus]|uniref:polysaccharide deacetylase family protein n=1 Tax=Candidatus Accumulibacter meliphilus TaxID=2211374 RepID=UPI003DA83C38
MNWDLDAVEFDQILGWLKSCFNVLPLDQAISRLNDRSLPARAAAITFDDGYSDNFTVAMPILRSHGLVATFFVATSYVDSGRMWNDTVIEAVRRCTKETLDLSSEGLGVHELNSPNNIRQAITSILGSIKYMSPKKRLATVDYIAATSGRPLPVDLMLSSDQVRMMRRAGMGIGAHTVTHPILAKLESDEAQAEILESKQFLESLLQERVGLFAYPNGKPNVDYCVRDAEFVRHLGFDAAVTTAPGVADFKSDRMQLPRFTPWDRTRFRFGARLLKNLAQNSSLRSRQCVD